MSSRTLFHRPLIAGCLLVLVGANAWAGAKKTGPSDAKKGDAADPDLATVVADNNKFAFALYAELTKKPGNIVVSPYSVFSALGMAQAGAKGETAAEIAKALRFTLPPERVHPALGRLIHEMQERRYNEYFKLHSANALWAQKGLSVRPNFLDLTRDCYRAELKHVDFAGDPDGARDTINRWVEEQTANKIRDLLSTISPRTRMMLTNAVYFKREWTRPFSEKATRNKDFWLSSEEKVTVPMMHKGFSGWYLDAGNFTATKLDMGVSEMLLVLPKKVDGLAEVEKKLDISALKEWKSYRINIGLPKFEFTRSYSLRSELSTLGMPIVFSPKADFSGISSEGGLAIDNVLHKAFINVNENGTEAAAASTVLIADPRSGGAGPLPPLVSFHADRPFIYLIRETSTDAVLFVGRVTNPASK